MRLREKLHQYGQFGEGDMPEIKAILAETDEVFEQLSLVENAEEYAALADQAENLRTKMHALVDGKSEAAGFDNLWATLSDTHGRWDEGEIDDATAKAECDAAIDVYKTNECLGRPPFTDQQLEDERRAFAEECDAEDQVDDETAKWEALIEEGAFVTMTVPLQVALMVADNEAGDAHTNAVMNLEMKLCEDLLEEYGVDEEGAWKINEALSKGGA